MKAQTVAVLALVSMAAVSTVAYAEFGDGPRGRFGAGPGFGFPGPAMMLEHMAEHLDLDDAQRDTVRNIMEAAKPELEALREQFKANRKALEALDASDAAYSTELNNIALSNGQLATEGTLLFTRIRSDINAVLTDEQRDKLARGKERRHQAFERRLQRQ